MIKVTIKNVLNDGSLIARVHLDQDNPQVGNKVGRLVFRLYFRKVNRRSHGVDRPEFHCSIRFTQRDNYKSPRGVTEN